MKEVRKIRIGVDIGSKGAIAIFINGELEMLAPFPLTADKPNIYEFQDVLTDWINGTDNIHVVIEDLHSIFGSSAKSNYSFGWINGAIEASIIAYRLPYTKVQPKKWQKEMWEGIRPVEIPAMEKKAKGKVAVQKRNKDDSPKYKVDPKATSLLAAQRLFPGESFLATDRSTVPHDGMVDAVLIGQYCVKHF